MKTHSLARFVEAYGTALILVALAFSLAGLVFALQPAGFTVSSDRLPAYRHPGQQQCDAGRPADGQGDAPTSRRRPAEFRV